jgi:hypothetical protein
MFSFPVSFSMGTGITRLCPVADFQYSGWLLLSHPERSTRRCHKQSLACQVFPATFCAILILSRPTHRASLLQQSCISNISNTISLSLRQQLPSAYPTAQQPFALCPPLPQHTPFGYGDPHVTFHTRGSLNCFRAWS